MNTSMKTANQKPVSTQRIKTKDLWQSAFMLSRGGRLKTLRIKDNGQRREVIFILSGENINNLKEEFQSGQATCQVRLLKASLMHLKDEMFRVIRNTSVN